MGLAAILGRIRARQFETWPHFTRRQMLIRRACEVGLGLLSWPWHVLSMWRLRRMVRRLEASAADVRRMREELGL